MKRAARLLFLALLLAPGAAGAAASFSSWEKGETNLYIGNLDYWWASMVADAAHDWNDKTAFRFRIKGDGNPACDRFNSNVPNRPEEQSLLNGVEFADKMCFDVPFDASTLAVVQYFTDEEGYLDVVGMLFNTAFNWKVYDGPLWEGEPPPIDFHRVALHELGHFMGLDHETTNVAIMQPIISDIDELQQDDIDGANTLYDPPPPPAEEEPLPAELCRMRQLQAASKLCKRQLACDAKLAKAGDAGARDACVAAAEASFATAWSAALAGAAEAGGCYEPSDAGSMAPLVTAAAAAAATEVGAGDASNPSDRALRAKLLKQAGALCAADLGAWRKEAKASNATKLSSGLDAARGRFVAAGSKAIDKAQARGVSYGGSDLEVVADALELMANQLGGATGP